MITKTDEEREICPFTLEPCEHCFIRAARAEQRMCPFSLEPCFLDAVVTTGTSYN